MPLCAHCRGSGTITDFTIESPNKQVRCTSCDGSGDSPSEDARPDTSNG